eukprot:gene6159-8337_t
MRCGLPGLTVLLQQAADAALAFVADAKAGVKAKVSAGGKIDRVLADVEQHAVHGFGWYASYAELLNQVAGWAARLEAEGAFGETEALLAQLLFAEYCTQLVGGIAMNQGEPSRPDGSPGGPDRQPRCHEPPVRPGAGPADDPAFPPLLAALDPPPPLIWVLGDAGILTRQAVAIVGARVASAAGQRFARTLATDLGHAGKLVVSGLARGIDGAAHEGSLPTGTVAVLGGGVGDIYPPEHADLHARIARAGAVVSESPPDHRAQARDFPRRNRLISGLSLAVVVVEAELKSGSLITARLADRDDAAGV